MLLLSRLVHPLSICSKNSLCATLGLACALELDLFTFTSTWCCKHRNITRILEDAISFPHLLVVSAPQLAVAAVEDVMVGVPVLLLAPPSHLGPHLVSSYHFRHISDQANVVLLLIVSFYCVFFIFQIDPPWRC